MSNAWTTVQRRRSAHGQQTDLAETIRRALVDAGAMSHPRKSNRAANKFAIIKGGYMPNGAIRYDEWLCTCGKRNFMQKAFCRECGEQPTKTQKQHGADTRRKITLLEEAAKTARELGDEDMLQAIVEHADARPIGAQLDSAIATAAKKMQSWKKTRTSGTRTGKTKQAASRSNGSGQESNNVEGRSTHTHKKDRNFPHATTSRKLPRDWQR